jgi:hypothetical protein
MPDINEASASRNQNSSGFPARRSVLVVLVSSFVFWISSVNSALCDFIIYQIPGTQLRIVWEGKTEILNATLLKFTYPGFPPIILSREYAVAIKAPTRQEEFKKLFQQATKSQRIEDYLEAGKQALQRGMLPEFYECCSAAYKINPKDETVKRLIEARKKVRQPLSDPKHVEEQLRETTKLNRFKVSTSTHYVMLHDTPDEKVGRKKQTRAATRLELLELVYEAFFMKFALDGVVLEPPSEHMMVLLFNTEETYLRYATLLDPELKNASGFWSPKDNIGVFFDQGTTEDMKQLTFAAKELQDLKVKARQLGDSRDIAYLANSFELIVKISKEESDIEVVSHEATHQLAGNAGLMPRNKLGLRWAQEGLASYFETPAGAGWGGIGAVNRHRLRGYRTVSSDPKRVSLEILISDALFDGAADQNQAVDAYGQAWALTHFLMETHFEKLVDYYRRTSEIQGDDDGKIMRKELVQVFEDVFGDIRKLERSFHAYMETLKTNVDRMREAMGK